MFWSKNKKNRHIPTVGSILTKIMAYFEAKTISKTKTSAMLLYTQMEHDTLNKHIMQEQQDISYRHLFIIIFSFKQHQGFFFRRVVNSWPGVEPWREILERNAIFFQRPLPGGRNSKFHICVAIVCQSRLH